MKAHIAALLALSAIAHARLGETPAECAARYGEELQPGTYARGGIVTRAWFHEGKCTALSFSVIEPDMIEPAPLDSRPRFSPALAGRILEANGGKSEWKRTGGPDYAATWKTSDGARRAVTGDSGITIQLAADVTRRAALVTPAALQEAAKGF